MWGAIAKDIGIAATIIIGLIIIAMRLINEYPKWQEAIDRGKRERAEIYAKALGKLGDEVKFLGTQVNALCSLMDKMAGLFTTIRNNLERLDKRCERHGNILARLSNRE